MSNIIKPKSLRNQDARKQRPPTTAQVQEWITAGVLAGAKKVYTELSEEHRKVFEMQEAGFMAVVEGLHARITVLEQQAGIVPPELATIRQAMEAAIVEYQNRGEPEEELSGRAKLVLAEQAKTEEP